MQLISNKITKNGLKIGDKVKINNSTNLKCIIYDCTIKVCLNVAIKKDNYGELVFKIKSINTRTHNELNVEIITDEGNFRYEHLLINEYNLYKVTK